MSPTLPPAIVWFRQDLRLADNPALAHAVESGRPVIPLFVLDDLTPGEWKPGGASRWWLHHSLAALRDGLARLGAPLVLRRGPADVVVGKLAAETGAALVTWNRNYDPASIERDSRLKAELQKSSVEAVSCNGNLLNEPWTVLAGAGNPYKVFTPYYKAVLARTKAGEPRPAPDRLAAPAASPESDTLEEWGLLPTKPDWAGGMRAFWKPGEPGALERLERFLSEACEGYAQGRNIPGMDGTSRLSPHLHFGELSPRQVWHAAMGLLARDKRPSCRENVESFLREIIWREFSHGLLYHFPHLPDRPLNPRFEDFPWQPDPKLMAAWKRGRTGYPIVDAGMRQLWETGWMHNRVRMIVGSLLVKHLLQPWQAGERWFWDTLVDADLANNSAGWQWIAGCGADAAPYFRVFNPVLQGEKFDPDGRYVRRWVPELARLPDKYVHAPWTAPPMVLSGAGVVLGKTYPAPVVEHGKGRERALAAFAQVKAGAAEGDIPAPTDA
ncbi:deoxyribodipyrimidine photo-lyase [Aerophototrophica crusticola]|uniref:Deoxyribodipyrimidine photo-lyase n=1 Tax=Aerophototrophica crusticola TaxID=1709002 RepID=A0A858R4C9_9PROT|nr:deoxyribodipyrimidine photo-lyase [Rhodospirillaceae bacterium B3]